MKQRQLVPELGVRLRSERLRLQISQQALAGIGQVTVNTQLAYEQCVRTPDVAYLLRLSSTGIDIWYVLYGVPHAQEALKRLDWDRLATVVDAIQTWTGERGVHLTKQKWAELCKVLCGAYRETSANSQEDLKLTIRALA